MTGHRQRHVLTWRRQPENTQQTRDAWSDKWRRKIAPLFMIARWNVERMTSDRSLDVLTGVQLVDESFRVRSVAAFLEEVG